MSIGSVIELDFDIAAAYDDHASVMLGFAVNALGDRSLAEDCLQETFLRAWRARSKFDSARGGLRTWLFAIERNVIVDLQRSRARMPAIVTDRIAEDASISPDSSAAADDRLGIIGALATLSAEHRQVILAVHVAGGTYTELSASTGVPVRTLRTRAFYALRALRTHIDGQEDT